MEITGIEITLQRISNIEQQFQKLTGEINKPDKDFQSILDASMDSTNGASFGEDVSKGEINQLIDVYSQKNGLDADFVRAVVKQ